MPYTIGIIGGTDSSGGSGIAADKKTTLDNNCIALPVITAITFQNSPTRLQIHAVPRIGLRNQLDSLSELSLNVIKIGGYKLGFWFAQQGSIYVFVALIFYYSFKMGEIDKKYQAND